jgi:hypothetical protein
MGDFGHYINKEISCFISQQKRIISLLSEDNKEIYNEGNISPSMATVPIISLQSASVHKNLYYKGKGTNC